jgi:hypothetical protein
MTVNSEVVYQPFQYPPINASDGQQVDIAQPEDPEPLPEFTLEMIDPALLVPELNVRISTYQLHVPNSLKCNPGRNRSPARARNRLHSSTWCGERIYRGRRKPKWTRGEDYG